MRELATEYEMSFGDAMRLLATRETLSVAADLLGEVGTRALGDFLASRGYAPPQDISFSVDRYARGRLDGAEKKKGEIDMSAHTKEEYRSLLTQGLNQEQIAAQWGIKKSSLLVMVSSKGWNKPGASEVLDPSGAETSGQASAVTSENPVTHDDIHAPSQEEREEIFSASGAPAAATGITVSITIDHAILAAGLHGIQKDIYQTACEKGWHVTPNSLPQSIALMHCELSEALQADRKHQGDAAAAEEFADVLIRIFDTCQEHNLDVVGALFAKMEKNRGRDHRHGGLKY